MTWKHIFANWLNAAKEEGGWKKYGQRKIDCERELIEKKWKQIVTFARLCNGISTFFAKVYIFFAQMHTNISKCHSSNVAIFVRLYTMISWQLRFRIERILFTNMLIFHLRPLTYILVRKFLMKSLRKKLWMLLLLKVQGLEKD